MKTFISFQVKILLVIFCSFASMISVIAQTFSILPSNTITDTAACGTSYHSSTVNIFNLSSTALDLSYTVVTNTMPGNACWDYLFCDWYECKVGLPSGTTHPPKLIAANTQTASVILDVLPGNNKGQGSFVITIFETSAPSNSQTVTWNISGCPTGIDCTSGIFEITDNNNFFVFPNPVQDVINVMMTNGIKPGSSIQVYGILGEKLIEYEGIKSNSMKIDLTTLPAGGYFIKYNSGGEVSVKQFFKIK